MIITAYSKTYPIHKIKTNLHLKPNWMAKHLAEHCVDDRGKCNQKYS